MKLSKIEFSIKNISFYVLGVLTIGFGVNLMILSELGAGAWDTPSANGQTFFNIVVGWEWVTLGMISACINTIILLMIILYRKDLKYFITLIPILIMGSVLDMWDILLFDGLEVNSMIMQVLFYLLGGLILPFGLVLVVKSKFPAFVFEEWTFMLQEITKLSFQKVRIGIEFLGVAIGLAFALLTYFNTSNPDITLFGQVGIGTIVLALMIGPLIQFYMRHFDWLISLLCREKYNIMKYIAGMIGIAVGVSFMLKSNIGNSSWDTLHYSLEHLFKISFGTATIVVAFVFTVMVIILNKSFKYLYMAIPIVIVGPLIDMTNHIFSSADVPEVFILQVVYFILGITILPLGGALLLISTYPAGVFDEFNLAVVRKLKLKSLVPTRVIMELSAVLLAGVLGYLAGFELQDFTYGKIGIGTLIFALTVGLNLKVYLKFFERIGLYENQQTN